MIPIEDIRTKLATKYLNDDWNSDYQTLFEYYQDDLLTSIYEPTQRNLEWTQRTTPTEEMIESLMDTMIWTASVSDNDESYPLDECNPFTIPEQICSDIIESFTKFFNKVAPYLILFPVVGNPIYSEEQFAHDYVLSRNGHGTGFCDRDLGDIGAYLHQAAKDCGEQYIYGDVEIDSEGMATVTGLYLGS